MNLKFLILMVASLLIGVFGYDFENADFNNYLFEEFQAIHSDKESVSNIRNRREVTETSAETSTSELEEPNNVCNHRNRMKQFQCCAGDKLNFEMHEAYMETKKQCYIDLGGNNDNAVDPFDCEKMQNVKEKIFCISECVAKKFNILDEEGALKRDVLLTRFQTMAGDSEWKQEASERIVDKCLDEVKEKHAEATENNTEGCTSLPMEYHYCLWREIVSGCPAERRVDTPTCNRMRDRLSKGGFNSILQNHFFHFLYQRRHDE